MKNKNMSDVALTLEQLREKNGQPVYWGTAKQWFIVQLAHPNFGDCVINAAGYYLPLEKAASRRFLPTNPCASARRSGKRANCVGDGKK